MSYNFFEINKNENNIVSIKKYNPNNIDTESVIVCSDTFTFDENTSYECEFIKFSHSVRKSIINKFGDTFTSNITDKVFEVYSNFSKHINEVISSKYEGVNILCCINYYDVCIIIPNGKYNIKEISDAIISYLNKEYPENIIDVDPILEKNNTLRERIIKNDRMFIKYHHRFREINRLINYLISIDINNINRKHEITLISTLLLKDLVEQSKMFFIYGSGEIRTPYTDTLKAILEDEQKRRNLINIFLNQIHSNSIFSDYIWFFRFLSQTLLSSIEKTQYNNLQNITQFAGFTPIMQTNKEHNKFKNVCSYFGICSSHKFFHSYLEIPNDSSINLCKYLPAFIHQFSQYINLEPTPEQNKVVLNLILYSSFSSFKNIITKEDFKKCIDIAINSIEKTYSISYFNEDLFNCNYIQFIENLRLILINKDYHKELYLNLKNFSIIYKEKYGKKLYNCINELFDDDNGNSYHDYRYIISSTINTFTFFFRQIRSDIGMCKFFNLTLAEYIELLASETMLCIMPKNRCADSTILRFGFMCRYLYNRNLKEIDNEQWFNTCIEIINSLKEKGCPNDDNFDTKCDNLKDYLKEFVDATIESEENAYISKGESLLENLLVDNNIISNWERGFEVYDNHNFMQFLKDVYAKYMNSDEDEKLKINCSMRVLFRDLYDYNPDLS